MRRVSILFSLLMIGYSACAQSSELRFGPSFGIGRSNYTGLAAPHVAGLALYGSIIADWKWQSGFGLSFAPATVMYSGAFRMSEQSYSSSVGRSLPYYYSDIYQVYAVEFPLLAKWYLGCGKGRASVGIGPGIEFTMGGTHSKRYDDPAYDAKNGYAGHGMREVADSFYLGMGAIAFGYQLPKGVLGLNVSFRRTAAVGGVEGVKFSAYASTVAISWQPVTN